MPFSVCYWSCVAPRSPSTTAGPSSCSTGRGGRSYATSGSSGHRWDSSLITSSTTFKWVESHRGPLCLTMLCSAPCQVDVLETQFSQLVERVGATHDYETIKHAHEKYLITLQSQLFLTRPSVSLPPAPVLTGDSLLPPSLLRSFTVSRRS